jgi:hypothetical protein
VNEPKKPDYARGDFRPGGLKPTEPEKAELKGGSGRVWKPEELGKEPADSLRSEPWPVPEGSERTWPGGGTAGIVDRLPEGSRKALGITGTNRLG